MASNLIAMDSNGLHLVASFPSHQKNDWRSNLEVWLIQSNTPHLLAPCSDGKGYSSMSVDLEQVLEWMFGLFVGE